jgi:hypothetical protein
VFAKRAALVSWDAFAHEAIITAQDLCERRLAGYSRPVNDNLLGIYLNDHFAGSTVGLELAKRSANNNEGTELGDYLAKLADEIREERETLKEMIGHAGASVDRIKPTVAWAGEKAGRLKLNGQLTGYSPLSRVVELEGLTLGVTGKLAMWRAVDETRSDFGQFDLPRLIAQAESQQERLNGYRIEAARQAFAAPAAA